VRIAVDGHLRKQINHAQPAKAAAMTWRNINVLNGVRQFTVARTSSSVGKRPVAYFRIG
jgi:hypothetical protein